ncbi:MAG: hypothetical protein PHX02_00590 [Oscillospiraceae bacterium]|jgi:hypothetical protein|nr:hypothetical protein [Oscillospiraceae bacterium]
MAREWALRGVSEEELKPHPKPEPPKTPRGKFENYWYHYKWHTIAAVAISIVLTVMIWQLVTRDDPDYRLVIATDSYFSQQAVDKLEAAFEAYGRDIDGDGKVEVFAEVLTLGGDMQYGMANKTKLIAHLTAADTMFFAFDKKTLEENIKSQEKDGFKFFAPIDVEVDGLEDEGRYWNWKNSPLRDDKAMEGTPKDLYFGVRSISGTSDKKSSKELHEQSMELLRAFLTDKKPKE